MTFSESAVEAVARAICCKAHKLGCAAIHDGSPFSACQAHTYRDDARNALSAALAVDGLALQGWRTIDSAPKDGSEIIGVHHRAADDISKAITYGPWTMAFERGKWRSSWDRCEVIEYMSDFGTEYKNLDCDPTHWQPLPAPPLTAASDGEVG